MRYKYTAKVHFEDGKTIKKHGDKISKLLVWMKQEAKRNYSEINGEIIDNKMHQIVKNIHYDPHDRI